MAPVPFFFGPADARLFGWLYPALGTTLRSCAILLCQPIGHEYMYSYRAFRHLAETLSMLGFPVLRFDYRGTGNADGPAHGPQVVAGWRESIRLALAELCARSGATQIATVGLRLGATFETLVAAEDGAAVDAMVLWEPCVTGKSYVRQIKMLAMTSAELAGQPVVDHETGYVEALGVALSPEMVEQLSAIDLTRVDSPPAPRILLMGRTESGAQNAFAAHLAAKGVTVTQAPSPDYDNFMVTAERSVLPTESLQTIVRWLETTYPATAGPEHAVPAVPREETAPAPTVTPLTIRSTPTPNGAPVPQVASLGTPPVHEELVRIDSRLFGVVTTPQVFDPERPAVIFLNMGTDHHVGPRRLHVHLARTLATEGFLTLRFDLSGIGDTPPATQAEENTPYPPVARDDVYTAIDYVRRTRGSRQVVLAGMCAGGYHAVHLGPGHDAVAGVIAINPPLYMQPGDPLDIDPFERIGGSSSVQRALRSSTAWNRLLRGEIGLRRVAQEVAKHAGSAARLPLTVVQRLVTRIRGSKTQHELERLFSPTVDTHLIFGAGDLGLQYLQYIGGTRLADMTSRANFTLSVIDGAGHVFMPLQGQATLHTLMTNWLTNRYGLHHSKP